MRFELPLSLLLLLQTLTRKSAQPTNLGSAWPGPAHRLLYG